MYTEVYKGILKYSRVIGHDNCDLLQKGLGGQSKCGNMSTTHETSS